MSTLRSMMPPFECAVAENAQDVPGRTAGLEQLGHGVCC